MSKRAGALRSPPSNASAGSKRQNSDDEQAGGFTRPPGPQLRKQRLGSLTPAATSPHPHHDCSAQLSSRARLPAQQLRRWRQQPDQAQAPQPPRHRAVPRPPTAAPQPQARRRCARRRHRRCTDRPGRRCTDRPRPPLQARQSARSLSSRTESCTAPSRVRTNSNSSEEPSWTVTRP